MSSELLAKEIGCGPICDNCHMLLSSHGDTVTGQMCDLQLALADLWRNLNIAVFGERRYWQHRKRFKQLDTTIRTVRGESSWRTLRITPIRTGWRYSMTRRSHASPESTPKLDCY